MKKVNESRIQAGTSSYLRALGSEDLKRNERGFIQLTPTAKHIDAQAQSLTTDIESLEAKLNRYRQEKSKVEKYQKTEEYQESKKKEKDKKAKKQKQNLLDMVFNNADHDNDEEEIDEEDEENYKDSKKKKKSKKETSTTLDTTYGMRFSPVVSLLHDSIRDFDKIAADIQKELDSPQLRSRSMYRSNQIGNLISAKDKKLSAVKELAAVATTISNLEYKKEKDKKAEEGSDTSRAISSLGAKFLRGGSILDTVEDSKSSKKSGKKNKNKNKFNQADINDDSAGTIRKASKEAIADDKDLDTDDRALAEQMAKALGRHKDIEFTPAERYMNMDGTYTVAVVADKDSPDKDWRFVAINNKTGKIMSDFKDKFPGLLPKKKNARMNFDLSRGKAYDKESCRTYKLMLK